MTQPITDAERHAFREIYEANVAAGQSPVDALLDAVARVAVGCSWDGEHAQPVEPKGDA